MKKIVLFLCAALFMVNAIAQRPSAQRIAPQGQPLSEGLPSGGDSLISSMVVNVNTMDDMKRRKLNDIASHYRSTRGVVLSMLSAGATSIATVMAKEIGNLLNIRSKQKRTWTEMRLKECSYEDSLQSVGGQFDFYARTSAYSPYDPSDMNFDGITLEARRNGKVALHLVCRIDSSRFDELFTHSRFFLVLDSVVFYPYQSFLPNINIDPHILMQNEDVDEEMMDYWRNISRYDFSEQQNLKLKINLDIFSSWVNEWTQIFRDEKLGSFSIEIPIKESDLRDSVFVYSREEALATGGRVIAVEGGSFVVPRSYMPVDADRPSWGTGEYKMKISFSETCRYNPEGARAKEWKKDYKQLVKLQNAGKAPNEYISQIVTTFRDNGMTILKATFNPAMEVFSNSKGKGANGSGSGETGGGDAPGARGDASTQ